MLAGESQPAGGDLIKQRLKQMKIAPVDERHRYGYVL